MNEPGSEVSLHWYTRSLECVQDEQRYTNRNADISHIEDTGAEAADAKIHEVDDSSVVQHTIQQIACSTTQHEAPGNREKHRWNLGEQEIQSQRDKPEGGEHAKENDSEFLGKATTQTEKRAGILSVF